MESNIRQTGKLTFALVTCWAYIGFLDIKLTQFNNSLAQSPFDAIKKICWYLNKTKTDGLHYWRPKPNAILLSVPYQMVANEPYQIFIPEERVQNCIPYGYTIPTGQAITNTANRWVRCSNYPRECGNIYKTILQWTVALSLTETEFYALIEAGKLALYVRYILKDFDIAPKLPTTTYEDNKGCVEMSQALKPTKRTRYVATCHFTTLDWI